MHACQQTFMYIHTYIPTYRHACIHKYNAYTHAIHVMQAIYRTHNIHTIHTVHNIHALQYLIIDSGLRFLQFVQFGRRSDKNYVRTVMLITLLGAALCYLPTAACCVLSVATCQLTNCPNPARDRFI